MEREAASARWRGVRKCFGGTDWNMKLRDTVPLEDPSCGWHNRSLHHNERDRQRNICSHDSQTNRRQEGKNDY